LGLGYPGGPIIEKLAKGGDAKYLELPLPLRNHEGYDFSFSGLKTSFYYQLKEMSEEVKIKNIENLAASFQVAVARHLFFQTEKAIKTYRPKVIFGVGGVMSNGNMRLGLRRLARLYKLPVYFPYSKKLNTDNAAMIAYAGWQKALRREYVADNDNLEREPRKKL
jgi:N6-L-threonylcarbamoyladenine synthase